MRKYCINDYMIEVHDHCKSVPECTLPWQLAEWGQSCFLLMNINSPGHRLLGTVQQPFYCFKHWHKPNIGTCSSPPQVSLPMTWDNKSSWQCITKQKGADIYGDKSNSPVKHFPKKDLTLMKRKWRLCTENSNGRTMMSLIIRVHTKNDYFHRCWSTITVTTPTHLHCKQVQIVL